MNKQAEHYEKAGDGLKMQDVIRPQEKIINTVTWGGHREGAGRPATGAMPSRTIRMTDDEYAKVKEFLKQLRNINYIGVHDSAKILRKSTKNNRLN
jgi:hypothetical protein